MTLRRLAVLGLLATALIVTALFAARAQARSAAPVVTLRTTDSEFTPGTQNAGWWDDAGFHGVGNDNYEVGVAPDLTPEILRNFFTFDASTVPGCARNARLQIPSGPGSGSGDFGGVTTGAFYALHDVETDALTLNTTSGDVAVFDDLGSGASYGTTFEPTVAPYRSDSFVVTLNGAGLADLNSAILSGDFFSVGGMIAGEPDLTSLFGFTPIAGPSGDRSVNLLITIGPCVGFTG